MKKKASNSSGKAKVVETTETSNNSSDSYQELVNKRIETVDLLPPVQSDFSFHTGSIGLENGEKSDDN